MSAITELLENVILESEDLPNLQELALKANVELTQLLDIKNEAQARLVDLGMTMPCGHLARYAVNGEDGTQYCCMCDRNAQMIVLEKTLDILDKTATCVQLLREVDDRVPGLLYDHYDENMVSLGVRINNAIIELDKVNNQ